MADKVYTQDELDAAVTAAVTARVKNHAAKLAEAQAQIDATTAKLGEYEGAVKERDKLAKRLGEVEGELGRTTDRLSLASVGIQDDRASKHIRAAYKVEVEGVEKPPTFAEWLAKDGADVVSRYAPTTAAGATSAAAGTAAGTAAAGTTAAAAGSTRTTTAGTQAAGSAVRLTPEVAARKISDLMAERATVPRDKRGEVDAKISAVQAELRGAAAQSS